MERKNKQDFESQLLMDHFVPRNQLQGEGLSRMPDVWRETEAETPTPENREDRKPFSTMGLYFIGEIHPNSSGKHIWILTTTDYFTKWVEAIPTKKVDENVIIKFLEENIFFRFGCPRKIVTDNAQAFKS